MGRDTALVELAGSSLLERAVRVARAAAPRVLLATGAEERYQALGLETVRDDRPDGGPLAGIEAALARVAAGAGAGGAWLGVMACDMPRAHADVLSCCAARGAELGLDAVFYAADDDLRPGGGIEPLLGAVHTRALGAIRAALERGERRAIAFHADVRVGLLRADELPAELAAARPEINVNTPAELLRERERRA
jgi:molybdopterin-guanine dinucleotide biosynthesis protein A